MLPLLLALSLAASPLAQYDAADPGQWEEEDDEDRPRLFVSAWGGQSFDAEESWRSSGLVGGEVAWAFEALDVGLAGYGYRLPDRESEWTPVVLLRLIQRFQTHRGVDATFTFGIGAGRPDDWDPWFQVALGMRMNLGPMFLGGELAFEQNDLLRLAAGVGVAF